MVAAADPPGRSSDVRLPAAEAPTARGELPHCWRFVPQSWACCGGEDTLYNTAESNAAAARGASC